jgi:hypothetical protein
MSPLSPHHPLNPSTGTPVELRHARPAGAILLTARLMGNVSAPDRSCVAHEPFGDNSRYWMGPIENEPRSTRRPYATRFRGFGFVSPRIGSSNDDIQQARAERSRLPAPVVLCSPAIWSVGIQTTFRAASGSEVYRWCRLIEGTVL